MPHCCELHCLLLLLLSHAADWQDSANVLPWFSAGFSSFPPTLGFCFIVFICLFYLWKGFSCSRQSGTGSDCSSKAGCIPLTAQPRPSLSFLLMQQFLPSQLLLLEQQMVNLLCWRQEHSLPVLPPSLCSRTAWEMGMRGCCWRGALSLPFIPCYHPVGFPGSDRLQGLVICGQILVDVFPLPQIHFAKG